MATGTSVDGAYGIGFTSASDEELAAFATRMWIATHAPAHRRWFFTMLDVPAVTASAERNWYTDDAVPTAEAQAQWLEEWDFPEDDRWGSTHGTPAPAVVGTTRCSRRWMGTSVRRAPRQSGTSSSTAWASPPSHPSGMTRTHPSNP